MNGYYNTFQIQCTRKGGVVASKIVTTKNGQPIEPMSVALTPIDLSRILDNLALIRQHIREVEEESGIAVNAQNTPTTIPQYRWVLMEKGSSRVQEKSQHWYFYEGHALDAGEEVRWDIFVFINLSFLPRFIIYIRVCI